MKPYSHPDYMTNQKVVVFGEFEYQAGSRKHPRRVVAKAEKPADSLAHNFMYIVTNIKGDIEFAVKFYCGRGQMENYIKKGKEDFAFKAVSRKSKIVNACRLQTHALAYTIINYMRRLLLPESMRKDRMSTIRLNLMKIVSRVIHYAGKTIFK